jgi:repressor LexA
MQSVTNSQTRILDAIGYFVRLGLTPTVPDLVERLGKAGESSLTPTLDTLAGKGYITIHSGGKGRVRCVALTSMGLVESGIGFPVVGEIPAGPLAEAVEEWLDVINPGNALRGYKGDFFLQIKGYSMKDAGILPKDKVLMRPGVPCGNGEIAACQIIGDSGERMATLKKLYLKGNKAYLKAANRAVKTMVFSANRVEVVGVYRGLFRDPMLAA